MIKYVKDIVEPLGIPLHICFGSNGARYIEEQTEQVVFSGGGLMLLEESEGVCYLWIDVDEKDGVHFPTVAHEALHVAIQCWDYVGANLDAVKNDEVLCYTMDNIVSKILDAHQLWGNYK